MSFNIDDIRVVFLEECNEYLNNLEKILLQGPAEKIPIEDVHTLFRAIHSIKGGSATFGMTLVTDISHITESLLDELRTSKIAFKKIHSDILLKFKDIVSSLINQYAEGENIDEKCIAELKLLIKQELSGNEGKGHNAVNSIVSQMGDSAVNNKYIFNFTPKSDFFFCGNNDPLIYLEQAKPSTSKIITHTENLPDFQELKPDACYLSWTLYADSGTNIEEFDNIFDWIKENCVNYEIIAEQENGEKLNTIKNTEFLQSAAPDKESKEKAAVSIRVPIEKIDKLVNLIGEIVIIQSMLKQSSNTSLSQDYEKLQTGLVLLEKSVRELQEGIMNIRMVPINVIFSKIPRIVYDLEERLSKKVELKLVGENTELDKGIIEKLSDPITHIIRNSVDHGIETPEERIAVGKPEKGVVEIKAYHLGGKIIIEIVDDGKGIDIERLRQKGIEIGIMKPEDVLSREEILEFIFHPGFSTSEVVTEVSGRGVGMDVVRKNVTSIGGSIELNSEFGKGTNLRISLPLTLAILDGQLIKSGNEIYIIPIVSMLESICMEKKKITSIGNNTKYYLLRNNSIPIIDLKENLNIKLPATEKSMESNLLIVLEDRGNIIGISVDEMLDQQQVVIKSLEENYKPVQGIAGATILGNGEVALILDVNGIYNRYCSMVHSHGEQKNIQVG